MNNKIDINNINLFPDMKKEQINSSNKEEIILFDFIDENHDGLIDRYEFNKNCSQSTLSAIDVNEDGSLDTNEINEASKIKTLIEEAKLKIKKQRKEKIESVTQKSGVAGAAAGVLGGILLKGSSLKAGELLATTAPIAFNVGFAATLGIVGLGLVGGLCAAAVARKIAQKRCDTQEIKNTYNSILGEYKDSAYAKAEYENLLKELKN